MAKHPDYPGVKRRMHRGKEVWRFRDPARGIDRILPGQPGDEEFDAIYQAVADAQPKGKLISLPTRGVVPCSFAHAQRLLEESARWEAFDDKTRYTNKRHIDNFLATRVEPDVDLFWKDVLVSEVKLRHLRKWLDGEQIRISAHHAKHVLTAIRKLIHLGINEEWIEFDPTTHLKYKAEKTEGFRHWPHEIREQYEAYWPLGSRQRTAYALAFWLGNRRSDVATLRWDQLVEEEVELPDGSFVTVRAFDFRQMKNRKRTGGKEMFLKVTDQLGEVVDAIRGKREGTILKNFFHEPYTIESLGERMKKWTAEAGIPDGYTLHGLRKSLGIYLAEQKATGRQIQDVLGHSRLNEAETYIRMANKKKLATDAMTVIEASEKRRQRPKLAVVK